MSEPPLVPALICQRCGATNPPHAVKCWLCEKGDEQNPYMPPMLAASTAGRVPQTAALSRVELVFLNLLIGCTVLAVLIGIGIAVQDVGLLIPYLIVVAPAFLATGVRAGLMVSRREQPRASTLFFTFLWSGVFTVMTVILLIVASVVALFLLCIHAMTGTSPW